MAEIKGVLLNSWNGYLKERFDGAAIAAKMLLLDARDHALLASPFLDSSWYPYETLAAFRNLLRLLKPNPGPETPLELGRFMARHAYSGVYRSLIVKDPIKQVEKFAWVDELFFRGVRKLESEATGPASCLVRYRYEPQVKPSRGMCASLVGFWSEMLEMAGAIGVKGAHPKCSASGSDRCEFTFTWDN